MQVAKAVIYGPGLLSLSVDSGRPHRLRLRGRSLERSGAGGDAVRLTVSFGTCSFPRLSPDGAWIAFVSTDEGNPGTLRDARARRRAAPLDVPRCDDGRGHRLERRRQRDIFRRKSDDVVRGRDAAALRSRAKAASRASSNLGHARSLSFGPRRRGLHRPQRRRSGALEALSRGYRR